MRDRLELLQYQRIIQTIYENSPSKLKCVFDHGCNDILNFCDDNGSPTALGLAAKLSNLDMIKTLLDLGADVNRGNSDGITALMYAVKYANMDAVQLLLKYKANPNRKDHFGQNAIFYGLHNTNPHMRCLQQLCEANINLNSRANDDTLPLHAACRYATELKNFCLYLIDQNSAINQLSKTGQSVLMRACATGDGTVELALVRRGADVNAIDIEGMTPAHEAARAGNLRALIILHAFGADLNVPNKLGSVPLHYAAAGYTACCKFLRLRGCNPNVKNAAGKLPITIAKVLGNKGCRQEVARAQKTFSGPGASATEPWTMRLYDWSVLNREELQKRLKEVAVRITQASVDAISNREAAEFNEVNSQSVKTTKNRGSTPGNKRTGDLEPAVFIPSEDVIAILQSMEAPITAEEMQQLIQKHESGLSKIIQWKRLLTGENYLSKIYRAAVPREKKSKKNRGLKPSKRTGKPLEVAIMPVHSIPRPATGVPPVNFIPNRANQTDFRRFGADHPPRHPLEDDSVWYLEEKPIEFIDFHSAVRHGDKESIKQAIKDGYHIDIRDKYYKTPLMLAACEGNLEMVQFLIKLGASVHAKDNFSWTPLHHAAHSGMVDVVELLVRCGAKVDSKAMNNSTPLFRAIETSRAAVVHFLINNGASIEIQNKRGHTPLDEAYAWADTRIIDIIRAKVEEEEQRKKAKKGRPATSKGKPRPLDPNDLFRVIGEADLPKLFVKPKGPPFGESELSAILRNYKGLTETDFEAKSTIRKRWVQEPDMNRRLSARKNNRERFGWDTSLPGAEKKFFNKALGRLLQDTNQEATLAN